MNIRVRKYGGGLPLVLVHGLAGSTAWWVRNVGVFSQSYTVYLVDLPGFGSMRRYANQFSVAGSAEWLANVMSTLNIQEAAIVGHSMGGLISALFAARHAERVTKLVLAAPAIALLHKSVLPFLVPLLRQMMYLNPRFAPTLMRDAARAGFTTLLRAARELLAFDVKEELASIVSPSLLVFGERDPLVPVSLGENLKEKIGGSSLLVLPHAGHVLMYDRADLFNRAVLQFLAS